MSVIADTFINIASSVAGGLVSLKSILCAVIEANNNAFTTFFTCVTNFAAVVMAVFNFIVVIISTVSCFFIDFILECLNFITAFLFLVWKLLILVYSVLDLVFRSLECLFYFIWTGGKWTAETIKISGHTLTENGVGTWKLFVISLKDFTNSLIGGFTTLGQFVKIAVEYTIDVCSWCCTAGNNIILSIDNIVRDAFNCVFDSLYYFLTDYLLNMPKEAYLGIVVCSLSVFTLRNIISHMKSRGLTFPLQPFQASTFDSDDEEDFYGRGYEFSDDEMGDVANEQDDYEPADEEPDDMDTDSSETTTDIDDDEELEVIDSSDSDEYTASESEFSEINIQLPDRDSGFYNLRRSTTPARFKQSMSAEEVEKVMEREKEKRMCVVCQDQVKSVLILPCRHMCLCVDCGNHIARTPHRDRRICPLCRTKIKTIMNVYL